jgi:photosystem II stability/assembly factor-like uncharacterized protein
MMELYIATRIGLVTAEGEGTEWQIKEQQLAGREVTSVIAREGVILAGTKDGIYRSADGGENWTETNQGLTERYVRWLAYHPDISDFEFAGTEPAAIFVSRDGGDSWRECPEVSALRREHGWWLPYSSGAGCVRGFAFHGQRAYAAVEVGAALRSDDGGEQWRLVSGADGRPVFDPPPDNFVFPDVHSVEVHPSSPDLVCAPTGGGFYHSQDGGDSWRQISDCYYVRAVWLDDNDPTHLILGSSDGPNGENGRIEVTHDSGQSWQQVAGRWSGNMVERFQQVGDHLWAIMANGNLLVTPLAELNWQPVLAELSNANDITIMN